ncbi:MAG: GntR family transcriptional regulator [Tetrasphaera sp.]|nr:GntR family transcriptional regulator [Tetrasphaera sp.]
MSTATKARSAKGPLARAKTSEAVAGHLLDEFVAARLLPGDRIDLFEVAEELGVSRQPVREALVLLERDGTVRMPFHRGAFLGDIDAASIREAFALYAVLSALTAKVAAGVVTTEEQEALTLAAERAAASRVAMEFELHAREFRRVVNHAGGGGQLRALLRTFTGLVVAVSSAAVEDDLAAEQALLATEFDALLRRDAEASARAAAEHVRSTGERGIRILIDRGAIPAEATTTDPTDATRMSALTSVMHALTETT